MEGLISLRPSSKYSHGHHSNTLKYKTKFLTDLDTTPVPKLDLGVDIEHLQPALPSTSTEYPTIPPPPPTEGHVLELGDGLVQLHGLHAVQLHLTVGCAGH